MANYNPKGREKMAALGRVGGVKSGESRRDRAGELLMYRAVFLGVISGKEAWDSTPAEIASICEQESNPNCAGGSHDTDWRCPNCQHFNSIKRRACSKCKTPGPVNGRLTRAAITGRIAEHETAAILHKHGLDSELD